MPKKIKTLIIGLGRIGLKYDLYNNKILTHSKAIYKHPNFSLVGGVEKKSSLRAKFFKKYKTQSFIPNYKMYRNSNAELVVISVNTSNHLRILKNVLNLRNLKLILFEKPVGKSLSETQKIDSLCKKKLVKVVPNYIRLFDKETNRIKKIIKSKFRSKFIVEVLYNQNLQNNCSHMISLLLYWIGNLRSIKKIKKINKNNYHFTLIFKNCEANFICKNKKRSKSQIKIIKKDYEILYKSDGEKIEYLNKKQNKLRKVINYEYINKYQYNVYEHIYRNKKNNLFFEKLMVNAISTQKIIEKIKNH